MNKENFSEIGEFIIFFKKYIKNPFSDMHFNFMNSLSPSNTYFNKNNLLKNMTFKNYYCNYASFLTPYILADGRISACCRDYDGSLVLSDIKTNKLKDTTKLDTFKDLQSFHEDETKDTNKFNLCRDCFVVDERISDIWNKTICIFLFKYPNKSEQFYQDFFDSFLSATLKDIDHMDEIFKAYSVN